MQRTVGKEGDARYPSLDEFFLDIRRAVAGVGTEQGRADFVAAIRKGLNKRIVDARGLRTAPENSDALVLAARRTREAVLALKKVLKRNTSEVFFASGRAEFAAEKFRGRKAPTEPWAVDLDAFAVYLKWLERLGHTAGQPARELRGSPKRGRRRDLLAAELSEWVADEYMRHLGSSPRSVKARAPEETTRRTPYDRV